jgi:membrane protein
MRREAARLIAYGLAFLRHLSARFCADRCLIAAAGLSYATLLSLVPLMTVAFAALATFPVFQTFAADIQDFIFKNFVPAFGQLVEEHLRQFVDQAKGLTAVGILFLIFAALLLMAEIERALNDIWQVRRRRRALSSFLVYWAVLSLGPLLIGMSLAMTSYLVSLPLFSNTTAAVGAKALVFRTMPFLLTTSAATLLYTVVPNRTVGLRYALAGALVAAIFFELANRGFAFYVTHFPVYRMIYGALAAIPVFLLWIYVSWVVILLGAEVTRALMTFRPEDAGGPKTRGGVGLVDAYRVVGHLWDAQAQGLALSERDLLNREPEIGESGLEALLAELETARLLQRTAAGDWMLARDCSRLTLGNLYDYLPYRLPEPDAAWRNRDGRSGALSRLLSATRHCVDEGMHVPLESLYQDAEGAVGAAVRRIPAE